MDSQAFALLTAQIDRIEEKVDDLVRWRYYFTGVAAVVGAFFGGGVSMIVSFLIK